MPRVPAAVRPLTTRSEPCAWPYTNRSQNHDFMLRSRVFSCHGYFSGQFAGLCFGYELINFGSFAC